jgi:diguanylate cyclase (GGDEF)-like protein
LLTIRNVTAESLLQKKYDQRKKDSIVDGLTRLFNKVTIEEYLQKLIKSSLRDTQPLSVVMCDLDHFKKINDTFGHRAGDHVLHRISQLLKAEARETDTIGRFGGEEFLVLLPKSNVEGARIFCERFRERVENTKFVFEGKIIPVHVSCGTASFDEEWRPGLEISDIAKTLITHADTALYFAKANGRNRTCQFEEIPGTKKAAS